MNMIAALSQIGFTEYEAKVYLELLRESPANGYQISKRSGVPRSMVYEALGRLRERGAALETIEERATLYRPLDPAALLDQHAEEHQRLTLALSEGLHALYAAPQEAAVWTITGQRAMRGYAAQMIRAAQVGLFLALGDADLDALRDDIMAACQRGVIISALLTGNGELACGEVARHPPLESVLQEITDTLLVVADNAEALIGSASGGAQATVTRNHNVVTIARQFVWMELFARRITARLTPDLLAKLDPQDRRIFEGISER